MGDGNIKTKSVPFNLADEHQKEMYEFVSKKVNFAGYVKLLIHDDMKKHKNNNNDIINTNTNIESKINYDSFT